MQAHFAHKSGSQCANGYETAIHLAVKNIIFSRKQFTLPECNFSIYLENNGKLRKNYEEFDPRRNYQSDEQFEESHKNLLAFAHIPSIQCSFDQVDLEVFQLDIRPDIVCTLGGKKLYVEVAVTHFVDDVKMAKLQARGISTLEIDVSHLRHDDLSFGKLEDLILNNAANKKWLINNYAITLASKDEPIRSAKSAARELIKIKKQKKRDVESARQAIRDKQIKDKFASTHEVTFLYGQQHIYLKLCKPHISATIKSNYFDSLPLNLMKNLADKYHAKYVERYRKWEFQPSLTIFYLLIQAFKVDCKLVKCMFPPKEEEEFFASINPRFEPATDLKILTDKKEKTGREYIMAALQAARDAAHQRQEEAQRLILKVQSRGKLIIYYSSKEEFLSLPGHTPDAWQLCQLEQFKRDSHTHPGYYYVDFEHAKYCAWLGERKDDNNLRFIWAEQNIQQGWLIP